MLIPSSSSQHGLRLLYFRADTPTETSECEAYSFQTHGLSFTLIDTPGFDDSEFNEAAILSKLAIYMALKYRSGTLLNAILYLHPIHELRLEGSALNNLNMFKSLCGEDFYSNVVLATSFWSNVSEVEGAARLTQLEEHFWGDMVQKGARSVRLPDEPERCLALLLELAGAKNPQKSLLIQIQMEVEGRAVDDTDAAVSTRWLRERHAIIEQHRREVKLLEQERKIISQCQQEDAKELAKLAAEIDESEKRGDEEFARRMTALSLRDEEMEKRRIVREREERIKAQRKVEFFEDQERVERERISRRRQCNDIMEMISDLNLRGSRQAYLTQRFWDLGVPICDVCQHRCSVQLSYCKYFLGHPWMASYKRKVSVKHGSSGPRSYVASWLTLLLSLRRLWRLCDLLKML